MTTPIPSPAPPRTASAAPVLAVRGLCKRYGRREVLREVGFTLAEGEILGFLGANGAGKSTTMRILLSLARADAGEFEFFGVRFPGGTREVYRSVGALLERADLYPQLTARENLRWLGRLQGVDDPARLDDVLRTVGLAGRADDRVKGFSQGMKQRLGLAQAILHRPRLLILDEPMTGLDPGGMRAMRDGIRSLAREEGMAVLFSSHLLPEVERLADRVLVIDEGRIVADGRLGELFEALGGATWELEAVDSAAARAALERRGLECAEENGRLLLRCPGPPEELLASLVAEGLALRQFRRRDRLEDLLLGPGEEAA